ncbi:hypothetical protein [Flavobacterium sp. MR2016-29]|uniref:hypothetical protein n=1 Tax=Flavobacterium sp. MR2016-29 TaxID=2783795 RepID=UPI001E29E252|nr:hypothetical protein [Flavobacterium sp. MR2016-29]
MKKKFICFLVFLVVLLSSSLFAQKENLKTSQIAVKPKLKGYPVSPFKDTLFYVYNKVGSFSAENRAKAITAKIHSLYEDDLFKADSLKIIPSDISQDIVYKGDLVLMSILDADAKSENKTVSDIAKRNFNAIKKAVVYQNENYSLLPKRLGYTALLILILTIVLLLASKVFNFIKSYFSKRREKYFKGFTYNNINVLTPDRQEFVALRIIGIIKIISLFIWLIWLFLYCLIFSPQLRLTLLQY